jgi:hypothetical protein
MGLSTQKHHFLKAILLFGLPIATEKFLSLRALILVESNFFAKNANRPIMHESKGAPDGL